MAAPRRDTLPLALPVRDALLFAVMLAGWRAASRAPDLLALQVAVGLWTALVGFLAHEWGHWLGALSSGARMRYPARWWAPFLFHFDVTHNSPRQFVAMSAGGYAANLLAVALIVVLSPWSLWAGKVAVVTASVGLVAALFAEVPTTWRVLRGDPLPDGFVYDRGDAPGRKPR